MKKLSILLIISGIILLIYPTLNRAYYDYEQNKVLEEWKQSMDNIDSVEESVIDENISETVALSELNNDVESGDIEEIEETEEIERNESTNEQNKKETNKVKQNNNKYILKINKIDLYLPILNGATDNNLDISLSRMNHTAKPGEIGNFAVAGHRSYTYGRHFNRLNEMETGDKIDVITPNGNVQYKVTETFIVEPEELWVLEGNNKNKLITLVTCTPIREATHRLIVRGKLVE